MAGICKYCGFSGTNDQMADHAGEMCQEHQPKIAQQRRGMIIIELEKNVFLAPWEGDPGRTKKLDNARQFHSEITAKKYLTLARKYRKFDNAKLINDDQIEIPNHIDDLPF